MSVPPASFKFCPNCGAQVLQTEHFCPNCGLKLPLPSSTAAPSLASAPVPTTPLYPPAPQQYQASQYPPPRSGPPYTTAPVYQPVQQQTPKNKPPVKTILLAVIIIAVVLIAVLASRPFLFPGSPSPGGNNGNNGNGGNNVSGGPSSATSYDFTVWNGLDPFGSKAFTIFVPNGWTAYGGSERYQYPLAGWDFNVTMRDSTGTMRIFFATSDFPLYVEPAANLELTTYNGCAAADFSSFGACTDGTWWLPPIHGTAPGLCICAFVHSFISASEYVRQISDGTFGLPTRVFQENILNHDLSPILASVHPGIQIANLAENPNLYKRVLNVFGSSYSGADVRLAYTENGQAYEYSLQLLLSRISITDGYNHLSFWTASYWGYSAPKSSFDSGSVGKLYSLVIPTVRVNLPWLQAQIQTANTQTGLIAQSNQRIIQMQGAMYLAEDESSFQTGEGWIHALDGTSTAYDSNYSDGITFDYGYTPYDCGSGEVKETTSATNPFGTGCSAMTIGTPPST